MKLLHALQPQASAAETQGMTIRPQDHWMMREHRRPPGYAVALRRWSGWGCLLCAGVAAGYGLWGLYASGSRLAVFDVMLAVEAADSSPTRCGPIRLDPGMNPLRVVLRATHVPFGSSRLRFEVWIEDRAGQRLWTERGALGSGTDEAEVIRTATSLRTFDVAKADDYFVVIAGSGPSIDDLRDAKLEIRRDVMPVDPRIVWTFGLGALGCLIVSLMTPQLPTRRNRGSDDSRWAA